jgi:sugar lactone lactonase YvrE
VKGREYSTNAGSGELILRQLNGKLTRLDKDLKAPTGVVISPDGAWLSVAESRSHWGFQYQLQEDASIKHKQKFYWFHVPEDADDSGAGPWAADREGRLYSATRMGVQVFDRNGRSRAILAVPSDGEVTALAFGGPALDTLYVRCADGTMYRRKFKVPALPPGSAPIQLPPWTAG